MVEMIYEHPSCWAAGRLGSDPAGSWFLTQFGMNTDNPSMRKAASANTVFLFAWSSFVQRIWAKTKNKAASVLVTVCSYLHVCGGSGSLVLVRCRPAGGRGQLLWPWRSSHWGWKEKEVENKFRAKKSHQRSVFFFLQCGVDICSTLSHPVCGEETLTLSLKHQASIDERCVSMVLQTKHWLNC